MKLNNKGFAISTVLYALLIMVFLIVILMMSIMASNRKATKSLVSTIEAELNRYNQSATTIAYDENVTYQTYTIPSSGWYKIELYGAEGGGINGKTIKGGKGTYTSGIIYLDIGTELSFYIGGKGDDGKGDDDTSGGANGGGKGKGYGGGGGGATDVRVGSDIRQRIMVAAGGGGATQYNGASATGGDGGGLVGKSGASTNPSSTSNYTVAAGGNQTGPYVQNSVLSGNKTLDPNSGYLTGTSDAEKGLASGKIGEGGDAQVVNAAGGGGGYIGGGAGSSDNSTVAGSGAGGSSFIAGYAGTNTVNKNNETLFNATAYYFIDGKMSSGINKGSGKARITLVSNATKDERPATKNTNLNNVTKIESCSAGSTADATSVIWSEIVAKSNGETVTPNSATHVNLKDGDLTKKYTINTSSGNAKCVYIKFNGAKTLDEIAVYHSPDDKYGYNEKLTIYYADGNKKTIIDSSNNMVLESDGAVRYSAWDVDYTAAAIPNGVYQLESVLTSSKSVLSAYNNNTIPTKPGNCDEENLSQDCIDYEKRYADKHAGLELLGAENKSQKWAITKIAGTDYYRIIETESNKALQIKDSAGLAQTAVNTSSNYGEISSDGYVWTQWQIIYNGDGTYRIVAREGGNCLSTTAESFDKDDSGVNINVCDEGKALSRRWILRLISY